MQKQSQKPRVQEVHKPTLTGSWHGRDAWRAAFKQMGAMVLITLVYLLTSLIFSFDSLAGRIIAAVMILGVVGYYQYMQGMALGARDAALGETLYARQAEGKPVAPQDKERCFHPAKGFLIALAGALPFVIFCAVFACLTQEATYTLGVLPSWTETMLQGDFGDALRYYENQPGMQALDVLRIMDRAMVMPFINVATYLGNHAALVVERLSPLLVLPAPLAYALGYGQGMNARVRVNTAIQLGVDKKKRKERRARRQRQRSNTPERLV